MTICHNRLRVSILEIPNKDSGHMAGLFEEVRECQRAIYPFASWLLTSCDSSLMPEADAGYLSKR